VPGVGPKTVQKLLSIFGSIERVRAASEGDISKAIGPAAAKRLLDYLNSSHAPLVQIGPAAPDKSGEGSAPTLSLLANEPEHVG
jgi:5'-3' exonuclease